MAKCIGCISKWAIKLGLFGSLKAIKGTIKYGTSQITIIPNKLAYFVKYNITIDPDCFKDSSNGWFSDITLSNIRLC